MNRDPLEALSSYYASDNMLADDAMLNRVLSVRRARKQKVLGGICGASLGAALAFSLLVSASRPARKNDFAWSFARYQMVNSGLAYRSDKEERLR